MSRTHKCGRCGSPVCHDEDYWAEGYKKGVCGECYDEIVSTCQVCGKTDVMPSQVSAFILVKSELARTADRPPGIFRVMDRPFLSIPLVGCGSMDGNSVVFVDKLPKPDATYDISGHICKECAVPFERTFSRAYRIRPALLRRRGRQWKGCRGRRAKWHAVLKHNREGWQIEKAHTRKTILANPDMLRDLECDNVRDTRIGAYAGDWEDLQKRYDLPLLPTYHEWLFVEHKGVKVFATSPLSEPYHAEGWFVLRPEPCFRNTHRHNDGLMFAACSLPTYPRIDHGKMDGPHAYTSYNRRRYSKPAIIKAIDKGILTQDGVLGKDGKVCICR